MRVILRPCPVGVFNLKKILQGVSYIILVYPVSPRRLTSGRQPSGAIGLQLSSRPQPQLTNCTEPQARQVETRLGHVCVIGISFSLNYASLLADKLRAVFTFSLLTRQFHLILSQNWLQG